jgi:hypothetical protein
LLGALTRQRIVREVGGSPSTVLLTERASKLTLADVAEAAGDWFAVPGEPMADGREASGLAPALLLLRRGLLERFREVRLASLAWGGAEHHGETPAR